MKSIIAVDVGSLDLACCRLCRWTDTGTVHVLTQIICSLTYLDTRLHESSTKYKVDVYILYLLGIYIRMLSYHFSFDMDMYVLYFL